jgi:ribonuclease HI
VLTDFIAEWTKTQMPLAAVDEKYWTMYFDGSLVKERASLGFVFVSPLGVRMRYVVRVNFPTSNNVAEYEVLINGLHHTIELGIRRLEVRGDS